MRIDTSFDFRTDAGGKDPDWSSPTLRRYHKLLWSKALPCGTKLDLSDTTPAAYLYHHSHRGEFWLASDSVMATYTRKLRDFLRDFPAEELEFFDTITYTIGGMMVFPGNRVNGKMTINGARGFHPRIADRFDLTLECVRRHYLGQGSPLSEPLLRYQDYFALFHDFAGYVDFFLLQDLIASDTSVRFFTPFDDFKRSPLPKDYDAYREFRSRSIEFVVARNDRIRSSQST
jgi:hypothetical protein